MQTTAGAGEDAGKVGSSMYCSGMMHWLCSFKAPSVRGMSGNTCDRGKQRQRRVICVVKVAALRVTPGSDRVLVP
jgi:hypothetical protein